MPLYDPSKLDGNLVLRYAFDDTTQTLRTTAVATIITPPALEVLIDSDTDNILIVGTEDGTKTGTQHALKVATDGSLKVQTIQIFTKEFDSITASYPSATQEVYQSRTGGIGGAIQETVTINYTDSSKSFIANLARS